MAAPVSEKEERRQPASSRPSLTPLVIYLLLFFVVWTLRATVLFSIDKSLESGASKAVYSNALKFIIWVSPALIYLMRMNGCRPLEYLKLTTPVNRSGLAYAVPASLIFFAGIVLFEKFAFGKNLYLSELPALALLSSSVSSMLEEIFFRGFVLNQLWQRVRFRQANLIAAALFTLVHWPSWLWTSGFQVGLAGTSLSILVLGVFLGYLMKWTNSLWPSIVAHVINNMLSILLRF